MQANVAESDRRGRIRAFDWLRGGAVLVMIQCHALTLLRPELRAGAWFRAIGFVDGLVAPSFIFAAGFSLALVQVRSAAAGSRTARLLKTVRRLAEVLIVATLVNWMWYPIFREPRWIFRIDILHCIGLALLIALPIFAALAKFPLILRWISLVFAGCAIVAAPFAESVKGPLAAVANISTGSLFPLLPWAGYVYLGASAGAAVASGEPRALRRWLLGLVALAAAVWATQPLVAGIYPRHLSFNDPANHAQRLAVVCLIALTLLLLEQRAGESRPPHRAVRFIEVFGTSSLSAYFFHQALLYYEDWGFSFRSRWGDRCGWGNYAALTAALIGCTFVLVLITDWLYRRASSLSLGAAGERAKTAQLIERP